MIRLYHYLVSGLAPLLLTIPVYADVVPHEDISLPNEPTVLIRNSFYKCITPTTSTSVINSDADFRKYRDQFKKCGDLGELGYVPIDFSRKTLLVQYASGSCGAFFPRRVEQQKGSKEIKYTVAVKSRTCLSGPPRQSLNAVIIPKIASDSIVKFNLDQEKSSGGVDFISIDRAPVKDFSPKGASFSSGNIPGLTFDQSEEQTIDIFEGYSPYTVSINVEVKLKPNFPSSQTLKGGERYLVKMIIKKVEGGYSERSIAYRYKGRDGKYYSQPVNIEKGYAVVQNLDGKLEAISINWITKESIEEFWRAGRSRIPGGLEEFKEIFPRLKAYGYPPFTPSFQGYVAVELIEDMKVNLYETFPQKDIFHTDEAFSIQHLYVKTKDGFGAGGQVWYFKVKAKQWMQDIDPAGPHYALLPTNDGKMALINILWFQNNALIIENVDHNLFEEQKTLLETFKKYFKDRDQFSYP